MESGQHRHGQQQTVIHCVLIPFYLLFVIAIVTIFSNLWYSSFCGIRLAFVPQKNCHFGDALTQSAAHCYLALVKLAQILMCAYFSCLHDINVENRLLTCCITCLHNIPPVDRFHGNEISKLNYIACWWIWCNGWFLQICIITLPKKSPDSIWGKHLKKYCIIKFWYALCSIPHHSLPTGERSFVLPLPRLHRNSRQRTTAMWV